MSQFLVNAMIVCVGFIVAAWLYVQALLWVGSTLHGVMKIAVGLVLYLSLSVLIVASLAYFHGQSAFPWWVAIVGWCISLVPGVYLIATRRGKLQNVGFFLPRNR